jgi:manganese/zinc/iron transport system substrate-binding protein
MPRTLYLFLLILGLLSLSGCNQFAMADADISERTVNAVTTTGMITDMVENVGGDRVQVTGLMGPGVDPHLYKATAGNVTTLMNADIIFYNGLHLEAQLGEVLEEMQARTVTVAVAEGIDESLLLSPPEFEGAYDPHVWMDVTLWMEAVVSVRDSLAQLDPVHAQVYQANADKYLAELEELHQYVHDQAARLPADQRVLITAHDAFNYFGRAYGFEVRGLQGISTVAEPSTADVQDLAAFIVERRIPALFVETSVPVRTIEAVRAAVQAQGFDVSLGGELFSDAMGDPETPEGTYIGMIRHNIDTMVGSLSSE